MKGAGILMDIWGDKDSIEVIKKRSTKHFEAVLIYHVPLSFPPILFPTLHFPFLPFPSVRYPLLPFSSFSLPLISDRTGSERSNYPIPSFTHNICKRRSTRCSIEKQKQYFNAHNVFNCYTLTYIQHTAVPLMFIEIE